MNAAGQQPQGKIIKTFNSGALAYRNKVKNVDGHMSVSNIYSRSNVLLKSLFIHFDVGFRHTATVSLYIKTPYSFGFANVNIGHRFWQPLSIRNFWMCMDANIGIFIMIFLFCHS